MRTLSGSRATVDGALVDRKRVVVPILESVMTLSTELRAPVRHDRIRERQRCDQRDDQHDPRGDGEDAGSRGDPPSPRISRPESRQP